MLISVPSQQARLVNLPAQPVQQPPQPQQQPTQQPLQPQGQGTSHLVTTPLDDKLVSSSPSRPSILRRREGDPRDMSGMPDTPPPRYVILNKVIFQRNH